MPTYSIAPTDLTFLLSDCPRCFHHKVVNNSPRFYSPMPSVFNKIDSCMKAAYDGAEVLGAVLTTKNITVKSAPFSITPTIALVIGGRMDAIGTFPGGEALVVDFKTSALKEDQLSMYWRQLMAYATALENPAKGSSTAVKQLALIPVNPESMTIDGLFRFSSSIVDLPKDAEKWVDFLSLKIAPLLQSEPEGKFNCPYCALRNIGYNPKMKN